MMSSDTENRMQEMDKLRKELTDSKMYQEDLAVVTREALKTIDGLKASITQLCKDLDQSQDKARCWEEQAELLQRQNYAALEELHSELAEREAEIVKLREALSTCKLEKINYPDDEQTHRMLFDVAAVKEALATPQSTSYLEQWEKARYGEPVKFVVIRDGQPTLINRPIAHDKPLYARKD